MCLDDTKLGLESSVAYFLVRDAQSVYHILPSYNPYVRSFSCFQLWFRGQHLGSDCIKSWLLFTFCLFLAVVASLLQGCL